MVDIKSRLQRIYSGAKINVNGKIYFGESEMNRLMMESRNFSTLLYAWMGWHNTIGPESKDLFEEMIKIENEGAKAAGFFFTVFTFSIKPNSKTYKLLYLIRVSRYQSILEK